MEKEIMRVILQKVARNNKVSLEEVIREISVCIDAAMEAAEQENNKKALSIWRDVPHAVDKPTPEELLAFLAEKIKEDLQQSSFHIYEDQ